MHPQRSLADMADDGLSRQGQCRADDPQPHTTMAAHNFFRVINGRLPQSTKSTAEGYRYGLKVTGTHASQCGRDAPSQAVSRKGHQPQVGELT